MRLRPHIVIFIFALFFTNLAHGQTPPTPLTAVELLGLRIAGVSSSNLELWVKQRGISFNPSDDFIQVMRRSGAGEILLARLRASEPVATKAKASKDSLVLPNLSACGYSFSVGDLSTAENSCRAAQEADGKNPVLSLALSNIVAAEKHSDEAIALAHQAIQLDAQLSASHTLLGRELTQSGKPDDAAAEFREAVRLNPEDIDARLALGEILVSKKNYSEASQEFIKVIKLQPATSPAHEGLARTAMVQRDWDTGVEEWREYLHLVPDSIDAHLQMGICLVKTAERLGAEAQDATHALTEAIENLREVVQLNSKLAEAHFWLTRAYTQIGNFAAARQEMQTTLNLEPDNPTYARAYTQLAHSWTSPSLPEVPEDIQKTLLIRKIQPVYPALAERSGVRGTVHCRVVIAMNGTVKELQVISGPPVLVKPALDAARQFVYQPTLLNGVPVEVESTISIDFPPSGTQSRSSPTH